MDRPALLLTDSTKALIPVVFDRHPTGHSLAQASLSSIWHSYEELCRQSVCSAGKVLDDAVASAQPIKTALELGTYCGYSAVRVARLLPAGAKLIAIDPSGVPSKVAAPILEHAGRCTLDKVHTFDNPRQG